MKKKNPILRILAGLVGGILGYALVSNMYEAGRNKSRLDSSLVRAATEINTHLPMMIDSETRMEKAIAGSGKLTYFITLPNQTKGSSDLSVLRQVLRQNVIANYKTNGVMDEVRKQNVVLDYQYKDKNAEQLFEIVVSPKDF